MTHRRMFGGCLSRLANVIVSLAKRNGNTRLAADRQHPDTGWAGAQIRGIRSGRVSAHMATAPIARFRIGSFRWPRRRKPPNTPGVWRLPRGAHHAKTGTRKSLPSEAIAPTTSVCTMSSAMWRSGRRIAGTATTDVRRRMAEHGRPEIAKFASCAAVLSRVIRARSVRRTGARSRAMTDSCRSGFVWHGRWMPLRFPESLPLRIRAC